VVPTATVRRECLDYLIALNENHPRRILSEFVRYYNESRAHRALDETSPVPREVEQPSKGPVVATQVLVGFTNATGALP